MGDIVRDSEFEAVVREFFASETELMERRSGRELPPELQDENSLSESTLRDLQQARVYEKGGYLNTGRLLAAFMTGLVNMDALI